MDSERSQNASTLLMVRPQRIEFNPETALDNAFQSTQTQLSPDAMHEKALVEFDAMVSMLENHAIKVLVFHDGATEPSPDSIFPNNWISFHEDGEVVIYPMYSLLRRRERFNKIPEFLGEEQGYSIRKITRMHHYEAFGKFLEGTGSLVLDRVNQHAYAAWSNRTHPELAEEWAKERGYGVVGFHAQDANGKAIYHTNVLMCVGEKFAVLCRESIPSEKEQNKVLAVLESTGHEVIEISLEQMGHFAGNMLEVKNESGLHFIILSDQAFQSLSAEQKTRLEAFGKLLHSPLSTIEALGGGSARCMISEVFIPKNT